MYVQCDVDITGRRLYVNVQRWRKWRCRSARRLGWAIMHLVIINNNRPARSWNFQLVRTLIMTDGRQVTYCDWQWMNLLAVVGCISLFLSSSLICFSLLGWLRGTVVENQSLTGDRRSFPFLPSYARPAADGWPLMFVNRPLQSHPTGPTQPFILSRSMNE